MDDLKRELARQLDLACRTLDLLIKLGCKDVLADPQYYDFMLKLNVPQDQLKKPNKMALSQSPEHRGEINQAITMVLEQADRSLLEKEIRGQVEALVGRKVSVLHSALRRMAIAGTIERGSGNFALVGKFKEDRNTSG